MNTLTKPHDWFATRLLNPTKGIETLIVGNITPETATLDTRDKYKNTNKVKELFTDEYGNFREEQFNQFYDQIAFEYAYLSSINTENFILDSYEKSESNLSTPFGKVKQHTMTTEYVKNPRKLTYGLAGFNEWSSPEFSDREIIQMNKYWDNEKQQWSEQTVNEEGLWGRIAGKPLVYATWDDEGIHIDPMTGEEVYHQKGEYKTDYWGNYYAETAENNEMLGKQYITWSEVLTDDGSFWNTFDVFDSDDIEQNIPKTLIRSIGVAALYLIPYTRPFMAYSTAAIQLGRALPQITKTFASIADEDMEFDKLNTWDNYMQQFGHSRSNYSQEHIFSFENVMDMAVQSVSQLCQQRAVGQLFGNIGQGNVKNTAAGLEVMLKANADKATLARWAKNPDELRKIIQSSQIYRKAEDAAKYYTKLGEYASRGYLIATSTQDTYRLARQYGFDTQTSAVISLSTMVGVGTLFSTNYFRSMLYNSSDYELEHTIRTLNKAYYRNAMQKAGGMVGQVTSNEQKKGIFQTMTKGLRDFYDKHINAMNSGQFGILDGMINESLEEVSEEVVADLSIQLGKGWNALKSAYTGKEYKDNYKFLESDPLKRYATAAVGGAIGGGIFRMADRLQFQKTAFKHWNEMLKDNEMIMQELVYLVSQGKANKILESWDILRQKNPIQGNISIFTKQPTENQAETVENVVFESFIKHINDMDTFLSHNNLKIDKSIFDDIELAKGLRASWVITNGLQNALFNDYLHHVRQSVDIGAQLNEATVSLENAADADKTIINARIKSLNEELDFHKDAIRNILDAKDDSYLGRLMMQSNGHIADSILPDTKNSLARRYYGKDYDKLEAAFKAHIDTKYDKLKESGQLEMRYYKAWNIYKELATSKELRSSLLKNLGKISRIAGLRGGAVNNIGELIRGEFSKDIDENLAFSLLGHIIDQTKFSGESLPNGIRNRVAARILGIKKLPHYISTGNPNQTRFRIPIDKNSILESINKYFADYKAWVKENENTTNTIPTTFNPIANLDNKTLNLVQSFLIEKVNNFEWGATGSTRTISDQTEKIDYSPLMETLDILMHSIGYTDVNVQDVISLIVSKQEELGSNFRLSKEQEKQLFEIKEGINVLNSLIHGAYDNYAIRLDMLTTFGANNFLNAAFKDKEINIDLLTLNSDQVEEALMYLIDLDSEIDSIIDLARQLAGQSTSQDKKTSYRYLQQQIDQVRSLFGTTADTSILPWDKFDMESLMSEIAISTADVETDEFYIENSIKNRNIILKFEREFYAYYNSLSGADKADLINKIRLLCEQDEKIYHDTSNISVQNDTLFKSTDLFHFLMQASLDHQSEVAAFYKEYHDTLNERCPFDTQEYVITSVLKLLYNNEGANNPWVKAIQVSIDELNKRKDVGEESAIKVAYNIIKLICFGGTGKTSTIIPAIYYGIQKLFPNIKCHFVANTQKQCDAIQKAFQLKDRKSEKIEPLFISHVVNMLSDEETFKNTFANSIIFIDECTNISKDDLLKLDALAIKHNVKIIASGDTTQIGKESNIDQVAAPASPQLQDSKRTFSDIMTYNMLFWERLQVIEGGEMSFSTKKLFELLYYREMGQAFEGVYFEDPQFVQKITSDYVEKFIADHPLSDNSEKTILIFTDADNATILNEKYLNKKVNGYEITVVDGSDSQGYVSIQGSEWDYVFSDVNLDVKDLSVYRSEIEALEAAKDDNTPKKTANEINLEAKIKYSHRVKEIYTLVSRARHGFVSTKQMYYGAYSDGSYTVSFSENNKQSPYPPITTGINADVITNYKEFKAKVLEGLVYDESSQSDDNKGEQGEIEPPVTISSPDAMSMVQCSPGFVWRDDVATAKKLNLTNAAWDQYKMIIYRALTENNNELLKSLPPDWQNGEYLIKFQKTYGGKLVALGNWGRRGKIVGGNHPWIVYSVMINGERVDVHLGMFHNEKGTEGLPINPTKPTLDLNGMHGVKEEGPIYYRINWDKVAFRRSRNPIAVQPLISPGLYQTIKYDGSTMSFTTNGGSVEQSFSYMNTTVPIFVERGDDSLVNISELLKTLKDQNKMLQDVYTLLVENGIYRGDDIHHILELISIEEHEDSMGWKARQSLPLEGEFISFIKLNSENPSTNLKETLKQWSNEYIAAQKAFNDQLKEILKIARSKNIPDQDKRNQINAILSNRIISDVYVLAYGKNLKIDNGVELNNAISNITSNNKELTAYNNAIAKEMWKVFLKIYTIANNADLIKSLKVEQGLSDEEIDILVKIINDNKAEIDAALKRANFGKDWDKIITPANIKSGLSNIKNFIKSIESKTKLFRTIYGFSKDYDFDTMQSILSKLNYNAGWNNNKKYKKLSQLFNTTYTGVLKDNKLSLLDVGLKLIDKTREKKAVTFTVNKVVQPGQIHMYFKDSVESSLELLDESPNPFKDDLSGELEGPSIQVTVPNGTWKYTVKSRKGTDMHGQYTATTDSDGITKIEFSGQPWARLRFKHDPNSGISADYFIGTVDTYNDPASYEDIKSTFETTGLFINEVFIKNGEVTIRTGNGIEITDEAAKVAFNQLFNTNNFVSDNSQHTQPEEVPQTNNVRANIIRILNENGNQLTEPVSLNRIKARVIKWANGLVNDQDDSDRIKQVLESIENNNVLEDIINRMLTKNRTPNNEWSEDTRGIFETVMNTLYGNVDNNNVNCE